MEELFHDFIIKVQKSDGVPIVTIDGVNLKEQGYGLVGIRMSWETYDPSEDMPERFIEVEYINEKSRRVTLKQSFP